jgi:DegV family protein with EDD domain
MISVVTDSAANLPRSLADELGVEVVPLYLRFGDRTLRDGDVEDFYARLEEERERVTTSAPSPGDFAEAFVRVPGEEVVCVTVAADVSASHRSASIAAGESQKRVEVVDSGAASMAQGFVALAAARAARTGASLDDAVTAAKEATSEVSVVATIDTFEYLQRSGRVNRAMAFAASRLDIKPVFRMRAGEIAGVARPRTRRKALDRVVEEVLRDLGGRRVRLAAVHAAAEAEARELLERVAARVEAVETHLVEFTPAMGAHTGPGVVGIATCPG